MIIRIATLEDIKDIKRIADLHKSEISFISTGVIKDGISKGEIIVVCEGGIVQGFLRFHVRRDLVLVIYEIAVLEKQMGFGTALIDFVKSIRLPVSLKCPVGLPANEFYPKAGFELQGTEPGRRRELNLWRYSPTIEFIYSCGNSTRFAKIANRNGISIGCRLPSTVYYPLRFADMDWKDFDESAYIESLDEHSPFKAVVPDIMSQKGLDESIRIAERMSAYVKQLIFVPKVPGVIKEIPNFLNNRKCLIGYSIKSRYSNQYPPPDYEFMGRPVHLLGGSIPAQVRTIGMLDRVESVDSTYIHQIASFGRYISKDGVEMQSTDKEKDFPYRMFEKTCENLQYWWNTVEPHSQFSIQF